MRHGFVKVAAATPDIRVADVEYNTEQICRAIDQAYEKGAKIVAFPELCFDMARLKRSLLPREYPARSRTICITCS